MNLNDTLVVIPARGGSKEIPYKNVKTLAGKPLVYYTIEAAREVFTDEQIILSTDDISIKACVEETGLKVPFLRPAELATDTVGTYEVLRHAIDFVESQGYHPRTLVLLQPTSPFRNGRHILEALKLYDNECEMVVSVKSTKSNPYYVLFEENENGWLIKSKQGKYTRRQDCPVVYELNGAIYIMQVNILKNKHMNEFSKIRKYVMDEFCSYDIDTKLDWEVAQYLAKNTKIS